MCEGMLRGEQTKGKNKKKKKETKEKKEEKTYCTHLSPQWVFCRVFTLFVLLLSGRCVKRVIEGVRGVKKKNG